MKVDEWKAHIERLRQDKDRFFAHDLQSPIQPQHDVEFRGLDYFPPDPDLMIKVELHEHETKNTERMAYTKGEQQSFLRWGEFRFVRDGQKCVLQAYKMQAEEDQLFIPFKDETSGHETYGAGRYLDLHPARDRFPDGSWSLDFNKAYNPWCCYSDQYTCPFVPRENWLSVPIRAGEKKYQKSNENNGGSQSVSPGSF
jgi:uncharacterized protein (DUF1684 family)